MKDGEEAALVDCLIDGEWRQGYLVQERESKEVSGWVG